MDQMESEMAPPLDEQKVMGMHYTELPFGQHRQEINDIRRMVFIEEQRCPEHTEWSDEEDAASKYFGAVKENKIVAILRLRNVGVSLLKMERVAVERRNRNQGIGATLVRFAMTTMFAREPSTAIYAYAQKDVVSLYTRLGFLVVSPVWIEDETNIPHQTIFWATNPGFDLFHELHIRNVRSRLDIDTHSIHHPAILRRLTVIKEKSSSLDFWNLQAFHVYIDPHTVSFILVKWFIDLCVLSETFLNYNAVIDLNCFLPEAEFVNREKRLVEPHWSALKDQVRELAKRITIIVEDRLNTGYYGDRKFQWNRLNSMLCLLQSLLVFNTGDDLRNALHLVDRGIIMGEIEEIYVPIRNYAESIQKHESLIMPDVLYHNSMFAESPNKVLSPLTHSIDVTSIHASQNAFTRLVHAIRTETPLLVKEYAKNWRACSTWNFDFFYELMHSRTLPVEVGASYSHNEWRQHLMTFRDFCQNENNEKLYIAQHDVLNQFPSLNEYIFIPDECFSVNSNINQVHRNMWIGPADTVSTLHQDPRNNLFVQIFGKKLVRLTKPENKDFIYLHDGFLTNTSQVDAENPDYDKFPMFKNAQMYDAVLEPGDALFIPRKWFHYVRAVTPSISLSYWFDEFR